MSAASRPAPLDELERGYLHGTFAELCRIESPSGRERACAERVIAELRALELGVEEDDAGSRAGSECGNLLARVPASQGRQGGLTALGAPASAGSGGQGGRAGLRAAGADAGEGRGGDEPGDCEPRRAPAVLLCAHLDTVPLQAPVEPELAEGYWQNANAGILGADNKAAIAVLLALARRLRRSGSPLELELLFTVCEETALAGARAFDATRVRSRCGYVFDHASPIGEVVMASPTHFRIEATFRGAAAHAGIRPEEGRSAIVAAARAIASMPGGRVDELSTVNVGTIAGGSAMNVVPERCSLVAEVRSLRDERAEELVGTVVERLHEAANEPPCDCDVDVSVERMFFGYRLAAGSPAAAAAESALRRCGFEPARIASGGASDANAFFAQGLEVVNLANGTEKNHEPGERVSAAALEGMFEVAAALVEELASGGAAAGGR